MPLNLDLAAQYSPGLTADSPSLLSPQGVLVPESAAFLALWEVQSQVATLAYVGLIAFTGIWVTLVAMLSWSLLATLVFCYARECGYPNILGGQAFPSGRGVGVHTARFAAGSVVRAFVGGIHAFVFARCSGVVLRDRSQRRPRRLLRTAVLLTGMTFFGVTVAEHLLRTAGYSGERLRRLALAGPFLNVPYRVLLGAAFVAFLRHSAGLL